MQLYYIRHGQSENNLLWDQTGASEGRSEDPALTEVGEQQAKRLAEHLTTAAADLDINGRDYQNIHGYGITHLYCSLMVRAVATAVILAQRLDIPPVAWPDLHETGGIFHYNPESEEVTGLPGRPRSYFETHFPTLRLPNDLDEAGWWDRPFEGYEERPARAQRVLEELLARHGGSEDRVALISHGGFYNHLLAAILGLPNVDLPRPKSEKSRKSEESEEENSEPSQKSQRRPWFILNNAAISRIDFDPEDRTRLIYVNRADYLLPDLIT